MIGDQTLFLRSDLVESAWRVAQPILDHWASTPPPPFPNYRAGSWGPKGVFDLIEADGGRWTEVMNRSVLERVPLFAGCDQLFLHQLAMVLYSDVYAAGDDIVRFGDPGREMFFITRGEVVVLDQHGSEMTRLREGEFFGETSLLLDEGRTATVRALADTDVMVLEKSDFHKVLRDHPQFARSITEIAGQRYKVTAAPEQVLDGSRG
jgi:hypothetical protein